MLFWFADDGSTFSHMRVLPLCIESICRPQIGLCHKRTLLIINPRYIWGTRVFNMPMMMDHRLRGLYIGKPKVAFILLFENPISNILFNFRSGWDTYDLYLFTAQALMHHMDINIFFSFPSIYMAVVQIKVNKSKEGHFW